MNRSLFGSQFWRLGSVRAWQHHLERAFMLCHPVAEGRSVTARQQEDCLSGQCCHRLCPLTLPATRSSCPGRVVWARRRWWPSWLAWRCLCYTTRPPACKENTDAFLFLFSFTDRASFEDLPGQLARIAGEAPGVIRMVIGSKFDQYMHTDVPERDLIAFRQAWELPLLRVKSVPGRRLADGRTLDGRAGLADIAHILNGLAEQLWHQDQVAAGLLPNPLESAPG
ncbi:ciliogenesis and planar polarity effector 2 isoform X7 [Callithrix jacchus]|uniref:ciliogenesis and planar polarity effector 2 isoform X6 n=1 Tax=Callithrix jacchus TaxID=9483 RepID=UPI0023DD25B6|nr:ciliogenesis and planar polarity effector 2 isoform X6 [Callithrix jacchus]